MSFVVENMGEKNLNKEFLRTLKKKNRKDDSHLQQCIDNIKNEKRLGSKDFLNLYSLLWKPGPSTQFKNLEKLDGTPRERPQNATL
jgi:hypothetical protein